MNTTQPSLTGSTEQTDGFAKKRKRAWSVTAVGVLLILQAIFLFMIFPVLVAFEINQMPDAHLSWLINENGSLAQVRIEVVDWSKLEFLLDFTSMRVPVPSRVITSLAFLALALPVLITGFLFLRLWRHAWTLAVFFEGAILAMALYVYFNFRHPYIYLLMISGIFMVFYLNYFEVQLAFQRYIRPIKR
jgi:hypothetical protein